MGKSPAPFAGFLQREYQLEITSFCQPGLTWVAGCEVPENQHEQVCQQGASRGAIRGNFPVTEFYYRTWR